MNAINLLNSDSGRNAIHRSFNINHMNNMNSLQFNYGNNNIYSSTLEPSQSQSQPLYNLVIIIISCKYKTK